MDNKTLPVELIEQIREGNIVLWVGAGFSHIAGYPSGKELGQIIKNKAKPEHQIFFENKELDGIAEEFAQLYSRRELEQILIDVFSEEPKNVDIFKTITDIPQIETIITTNYDRTFEKVYGKNITKIVLDNDILKSKEKDKVKLYKIHGCIDFPEKIIITKSDYVDYYNKNRYDLLWNELKSIVAKNSVLFIGYSFEDHNIKSIFEDVLTRLGPNHNDYYLITRNLPEHKQQVLEKYSIKYLKMGAEEAISEIAKAIEKFLIIDAEKGYIRPTLRNRIFFEKGINATFISGTNIDENLWIKSIGPIKPNKAKGTISFIRNKENVDKIKDFYDIAEGKKLGKCELTIEKDSLDFEYFIGNSVLFGKDAKKVYKIEIRNAPKKFKVDLLLKNTDIAFENVKSEVYSSNNEILFKIFPPGFEIGITMSRVPNSTLISLDNINYKANIRNIIQGVKVYNFLKEWANGNDIQIFQNTTPRPLEIPYCNVNFPKDFSEKIINDYNLFNDLLNIQKFSGIKFKNFKKLSWIDLHHIRIVNALIKNEQAKIDSSIYHLSFSSETDMLKANDSKLLAFRFPKYGFKILGNEIVIDKCEFCIYDPIIKSEDMDNPSTHDEKTNRYQVTSKSNKIYILHYFGED